MDVLAAYLNSPLEEIVYVKQPEGIEEYAEGKIWKLKKSLYGLKQSAREWHKKINKILTEMGLIRLHKDRCVYATKEKTLFIGIHVDDVGIWGEDEQIKWFKASLKKQLEVRDLGKMSEFLSLNIVQQNGKITIDQVNYLNGILDEYGLANAKARVAPLEVNNEDKTEGGNKPVEKEKYQRAVGRIVYLINCSRPDLTFALSRTSSNCKDPRKKHWTDVTHVMRYLKGTKDLKIVYKNYEEGSGEFKTFCDADYNNQKGERISYFGYVILCANAPIIWKTKKQTITVNSTVEAEYIAMCEAARESLWLMMIMTEMGQQRFLPKPFIIKCDNQGAIKLSESGLDSDRSKHIDIKYCFLQGCVEKGKLGFEYVPTYENLADLFTKALPGKKTNEFVSKMLE